MFLHSLILDAATKVTGKKKFRFNYRISAVAVCRPAFCVALGLPCNSQRILRLQGKVNKGEHVLTWRHERCGRSRNQGDVVRAFLRHYIHANAEKSPVKPLFLIQQPSIRDLFRLFRIKHPDVKVVKKTFQTYWQKMFHFEYVDPETHKCCKLQRKKIYAPGFKICDLCVALKLAVSLSKGKAAKADAKQELREHKQTTRRDREMLFDIKEICRNSDTDVGATIDCPDVNKFLLPTTANKAAVMGGLSRLKTKQTAIEFFSRERTILFYWTLPDIRTGDHHSLSSDVHPSLTNTSLTNTALTITALTITALTHTTHCTQHVWIQGHTHMHSTHSSNIAHITHITLTL